MIAGKGGEDLDARVPSETVGGEQLDKASYHPNLPRRWRLPEQPDSAGPVKTV
jgi:hypothetical protein